MSEPRKTASARQRLSLGRAPAALGWLSVDLPVDRTESNSCEDEEFY